MVETCDSATIMKCCPVDNTLKYIGKKWAINIIRDLFHDKKRFKDFLSTNKDLSSRVLSERLKDLETNGIVNKEIVSTSPILIEYHLSKKGRALKGIVRELALFSVNQYSKEVLVNEKKNLVKAQNMIKKAFADA